MHFHIATLTFGKWDHWRDDWVIMQAEVHDWWQRID
jgi:hypothetical protein